MEKRSRETNRRVKRRTDEQRDGWEVRGLKRPEIVAFNEPQLLPGLTEGSEPLRGTQRTQRGRA